jgi:phosphopantothenoylcysteine decarboxylase/phosphopantothenate--cysteine ligase
VADFRPAKVSESKIKKTDDPRDVPQLELERTADVLAELVTARTPGQVVVGFAAETGDDAGDVLAHARAKLARKGSDLLVVNDVTGGGVFGQPRNAVTVLDARGGARTVPEGTKEEIADVIWDVVTELWKAAHTSRDTPVE